MFFQYGNNLDSETDHAKKITMCMELLKNHDSLDVRIPMSCFKKVPLCPVTDEFDYGETRPLCLNYQLLQTSEYKNPSYAGLTPGYDQVVFQVNPKGSKAGLDPSQMIEEMAEMLTKTDESEKVSPYTYLLPGFKEMCKKMPLKLSKRHLAHHMK